ncbi:CDP-glycerol glycerophosphotransferase family protein [Pseudoxanthomonas sp. SGNA-20]|uniref:CDP-glycerol glycerophosphotransferase family protein n=1 Tax=Pseudoxanthomonas sp. SGNA-20 TaxID=2493088 RepID=UPI0018F62AEB|nr:CDP-glycerol glycerophosphotransferase family protein [Pseudoxanthomonas sp. SGNA-20]
MRAGGILRAAWRRRIAHAWTGIPLLALWRLLDLLVPKRRDHWALFAHPLKPGQLVENARAVHEALRGEPGVRTWVFVRGTSTPPPGVDPDTVVELGTLAGLWRLARCGVLLLTNSTSMDMSLAWSNGGFSAPRPWLRRRVVVNLWHGIPLKRLFALANPEQRRHGDRNRFRRLERRHYDGLVASSDVDAHAMAASFHPLPPERVWATGLPRNDFLVQPEADLPAPLRAELERVRALCAGRRLVLYAPTYRDASVARELGYHFSAAEIAALGRVLERHGAVLGVRGHYLANAGGLLPEAGAQAAAPVLDLGHARFHEIAPLLRHSSLVVTDYSSVYIDALYLDLPVLSFAYDLDHYRDHQNGLLYDMELAFPGPVARDFDGMLRELDRLLSLPAFAPDAHYRQVQRLFFRHLDAGNTGRVIARVRQLAGV